MFPSPSVERQDGMVVVERGRELLLRCETRDARAFALLLRRVRHDAFAKAHFRETGNKESKPKVKPLIVVLRIFY